MLQRTYVHIDGIGKGTEQALWRKGMTSWDEFIENGDALEMPVAKKERIYTAIEQSKKELAEKNHRYFVSTLPKSEHWRAFKDFEDSVVYLDIETTGLSSSRDELTIVGMYDGHESKIFVKGDNLDDIVEELAKYKMIVSFNGLRFDVPFIQKKYPQIDFNHLHIDLMYVLRRIGLKGGLKNIEKLLGIGRSDDTCEMTGFDAVRLWRHYERGDDDALKTLVAYNREDIENLKTIMHMVYEKVVDNEMGSV